MSKVYTSIEELIGGTPLLRLDRLKKHLSLECDIYAKLESFNPGGSTKDRAAYEMLEGAIRDGLITKDTVIIEPTSGNTGIGLALIGAARGLRTVIVMPDSMSRERQLLMSAYGAELVLTDGALGMAGAIAKANELCATYESAFIPSQFTNENNRLAHYKTTGPEIYDALCGKVDIFVAGVGTGGTVSGVGRYLKERCEGIKIVGVEPADSPMLTEGRAGAHKLQGIGANFVPEVLDRGVLDEVMTATADEAFECARLLARCEGVLAGISSGAALSCAIRQARRDENSGKSIVVLLTDTGERYLSSGLFD